VFEEDLEDFDAALTAEQIQQVKCYGKERGASENIERKIESA
jgi:hypothetical protein